MITLQYTPISSNFRLGTSVEKPLYAWGIKSCVRECQNMAQDNLAFDVATRADSPELFPYGSMVTIWLGRKQTGNSFTGGKKFFVGFRKRNVRTATGSMQAMKYKFTGPWGFFMEQHVFQKLWPTLDPQTGKLVLQPRSAVTLGLSVATITQANGVQTTQMTIAEQAVEIINFTATQTLKQYGQYMFTFDSALPNSNFDGVGGWNGYCPLDAGTGMTCAEALKKTVKIIPAVSMWFDYTAAVPTLHIGTRNTLSSTTLPWNSASPNQAYGVRTSDLDRRDDLIPPAVAYQYNIQTVYNGTTFNQIVYDIGCSAGYTNPKTGITAQNLIPFSELFGAETTTFDFSGGNYTQVELNTIPVPFDPGNNSNDFAVWTQTLASALSDATVTNVTVPAGAQAILTNKDGTAADPRYQYILQGGPVTKGIYDTQNPNLKQGVELQLSCPFTFTTQQLSSDGHTYIPLETKTEQKSVTVNGFSIASGLFSTVNQAAEPIPFGLANFIYNIQKTPQYDGTHGFVEQDAAGLRTITDPCPVGVNLNLSGSLPEYLTMNAQVQQASYDLMTGRTTLTIGVASHLGGTEMIERLRINRGPRWYYEINNGLVNSNQAVSGATQLKDTQVAVKAGSATWMPPNGQTNTVPPGSTSGNPGSTIDTRTGASLPNYGNFVAGDTPNGVPLNAPTGPTHYIADPNSTGLIRIASTDCLGKKLSIFEYKICWDFGKGTVPAYVLLLGCAPYPTSLLG